MPINHVAEHVFEFVPNMQIRWPAIQQDWQVQDYANETMLFAADLEFARTHGGPMTCTALEHLESQLDIEALETEGLRIVIDTRVHMLMAGMIPAIGGWHCDALKRDPTTVYGNQPNPLLHNPGVRHFTVTFSTSDTSRTAFALGPTTVRVAPGTRTWTTLHNQIVQDDTFHTLARHGVIYEFDQGTAHKATASVDNGWRFFFRLSLCELVPQNQIRRQVQVYIPSESHGW